MRRLISALVCIFVVLGNLSCSANILKTFADTGTNEALYEDALALVNSGDYSGALSKISDMTGSYPTMAKVLELKASAYGGLCGFNFLTFALSLRDLASPNRLFPFLLQSFDAGVASNIDNCKLAQSTIESIGTITERSTDENIFLALIALAKIGNILSYYDDSGHTGSPTLNYDACAVGGARAAGGAITDSDAREIGTGITLAIANLNAVAGAVNLGTTQLTDFTTLCGSLPPGYNFCSVTDPTAFTATEVQGIRSLVKENSVVGLGLTNGGPVSCPGDLSQCNCF